MERAIFLMLSSAFSSLAVILRSGCGQGIKPIFYGKWGNNLNKLDGPFIWQAIPHDPIRPTIGSSS
jgi:hypothetical protein